MNRHSALRAIGLVVMVVLSSHVAVAVGSPVVTNPQSVGITTLSGKTVGMADKTALTSGDPMREVSQETDFTEHRSETLVDLVNVVEASTVGIIEQTHRIVPPTVLIAGGTYRENGDPCFENERREAIYRAITDSPGRYVADLEAHTGIPASTVRYHVRVLEDEGHVRSAMIRGKRRFYPPEMDRWSVELDAALNDASTAPILEAVARLEPVTVSELSDEVHVSPSTISYHINQLTYQGLVDRERTGQSVAIRLTSAVRTHLTEIGDCSG